ncbi:MAG: transglycosylase domain-containing protein [Paucimonas sp.]|jgi:hypothetical protein|nr:transglycosylase domain-containing protein [Paucimonas sp.]
MMSAKIKFMRCVFGAATAISIIFAVVLGKELIEFKSHKAQIYTLLEESEAENTNPPPLLKEFIKIAHGKGTPLVSAVARKIISRLGDQSSHSMIEWHTKYFIWSALVAIDFSESEIYSLYCALSFNGIDYGAERLARRMFNKSLDALSEDEMATVVSILWNPSRA